MNIYNNPSLTSQYELSKRPLLSSRTLRTTVIDVFNAVQRDGNDALVMYTEKFDSVTIERVKVKDREYDVSDEVKKAINQAMNNISVFHSAQVTSSIKKVQTTKGVTCWNETRPIERVGIYIPGGTAPLISTAMMLGIPARIAGCKEIVLCTPPQANGLIPDEIGYIASLLGITEIYSIGGAQAIAAMSLGTQTIRPVDKIFGPGNQYVNAAKQYANENGVAIDMVAGPSEVMVVADEYADPAFVAADLLSQLEHGVDSQAVLVVTSRSLTAKVSEEIEAQLQLLSRAEVIRESLQNSYAVVLSDSESCYKFVNMYAPEHLIVATKSARSDAQKVTRAGSVFIGAYSPESAGDYASGTNHTLPTNGWSKSTSGVSVSSFQTSIQFQELTQNGLASIAKTVNVLAGIEGLDAHASAVTIRLKKA